MEYLIVLYGEFMKEERQNKLDKRKLWTWSVCIIALVLIFIYATGGGNVYIGADDATVAKNLKKIEEINKTLDTNKVDMLISKAEYVANKNSSDSISNKELFRNSVLIGDSMSEGVVAYGLLDAANVFAVRGRMIISSDQEIASAISFRPENLFMQYGLNDIISYGGNPDPFIKEYKNLINRLKKELPDTKLYVVGMPPVSQKGISSKPSLGKYDVYNEQMEKMCADLDITYVDTTVLMTSESQYEFDGIHPKQPYYTNWVELMVSYVM